MHIASLLPEIDNSLLRPKIKSQRAYVISLFVEKLNSERGDRKPLSPKLVALKMSHLDIEDLYFFLSKCEKASCGFSPAWWHDLKTVDKVFANKFKRKYN